MTKFGITEERLAQIKRNYETVLSDKDIQGIVDDWGAETINKGYVICDFDSTGMLEVVKIDDVTDEYDDEYAVELAMKDGIKFIPISELPDNFERRYLGWIDTPENREAIKRYCQNQM